MYTYDHYRHTFTTPKIYKGVSAMETLSTILGISMVILALISIGLLGVEVLFKGPKERNFTSTFITFFAAAICLVLFLIIINQLL